MGTLEFLGHAGRVQGLAEHWREVVLVVDVDHHPRVVLVERVGRRQAELVLRRPRRA